MAFKAITKGKEGDGIKVTSHIEGFWGNDKICAYGLKGLTRFLCMADNAGDHEFWVVKLDNDYNIHVEDEDFELII